MAHIARIIALGASNLTRGFQTVVSAARAEWGPDIQVLAALGHGRSYGGSSRVLGRTLPGILQSGLWWKLASMEPASTRALVTDVGNDILYGHSAGQILEWMDEIVRRLREFTPDIVLTELPLESIRRLSPRKYLLFRSILFPSSSLSFAEVMASAVAVNTGLEELADGRGLTFFRLNPAWYGFDPIHIRPSLWRRAWQQILGVHPVSPGERNSLAEGLKLYLMAPERRRLFGIEQYAPQAGARLSRGGRVWVF